MTPFSDDRAWVKYNTSTSYDTERYGVIDSNGFLLWSIASSDLSTWKNISVSTFEDGLSCLYPRRNGSNSGMIVVNGAGDVVFDSRNSSDGISWYYLGYGDGTFLALQNIASFSENNTYICEINSSGDIASTIDLPSNFGKYNEYNDYIDSDFSYYGNELFVGTQVRSTFYEFSWVYNRRDHYFYKLYDRFATKTIGDGIGNIVYGDWDGNAWGVMLSIVGFISDDEVLCMNDDGTYFKLNTEMLMRTSNERILIDRLGRGEYGYYGDGVFNCKASENAGIYNLDGNLIASYPDNWVVKSTEPFSEGYAAFELTGADGNDYVLVVDHNLSALYDPIKVSSCSLPSWHGYVLATINGEEKIIAPDGSFTDLSNLAVISEDYDIGRISVRGGFKRLYNSNSKKNYAFERVDGVLLDTVYEVSNYDELVGWGYLYPHQENEATEPQRVYASISSLSLEGKWKNVGSSTYGQVQSGAIVAFDGTHCNVVSPQDTYAFYKNGDSWRLDCTTLLGDTLSFTVKTVDEDNIDIYFGSSYLEMTRIN